MADIKITDAAGAAILSISGEGFDVGTDQDALIVLATLTNVGYTTLGPTSTLGQRTATGTGIDVPIGNVQWLPLNGPYIINSNKINSGVTGNYTISYPAQGQNLPEANEYSGNDFFAYDHSGFDSVLIPIANRRTS